MKNCFLILLFISIISCRNFSSLSQEEFSLLGKWQNISYSGSDGATSYTQPINNGRVIVFEKNNIFHDLSGKSGTYEVMGDSLHLILPDKEEFYRFYYNNENLNKVHLTPVTNKYQFICDEGCSDTYKKIK